VVPGRVRSVHKSKANYHASWPLRQSPKKVHEEMGSAANQRGGVGPMKAENKTRDGIGSFASPGGLRGCVF
jgi:hypothetical protein